MYRYNRKKELVKTGIYVFFILGLAVFSTYYIYNKFQGDRNIDFNSESLDVTYHESTGDKLTLNKVTPVTDSVGLSSKAYLITIKNNLTEKVDYRLKVIDDIEEIAKENNQDDLIPKDDIRISIKVNRNTKIFSLNELDDNVLLVDNMDALEVKNIAIRIWIKQDSTLPRGSNMYYHGIMQIVEENNSVAVK